MTQGRWGRLLIALCMTGICALTSGCKDYTDVNDIHVVVALAVDAAKDGSTMVTAEIVNPQNAPSAGGSGGGSAQGGVAPYLVRTTVGDSVEDAIEKFEPVLPYHPYLPHNTVVVFGRDFLMRGIQEALDYFERNRNFRRSEVFVATSGLGRTLLTASTEPEALNAFGLRSIVDRAAMKAPAVDSEQLRVVDAYLSPSHAPVMAWVDVDDDGKLVMKGVALLRNGQIGHYLNLPRANGLYWLLGPTHEIKIQVPCPGHTAPEDGQQARTQSVTLRLLQTHTRVTPELNPGGQPRFRVFLRGTGEIERLCPGESLSRQLLQQLEQAANAAIRSQINDVIQELQARDIDACQFGTALYHHYPAWWRLHEANWPREFQRVPVTVDVQISVVRVGLTTHSVDVWMRNGDRPPRFDKKE